MPVVIGIDRHKASHTAVVIDETEREVGTLSLRANARQADKLLEWASSFPERTWAIEGAEGLGHLLAQQLVATGEEVVDVPPKLAARVRLLGSGRVHKNDENDARSIAVAALRSSRLRQVRPEDHASVLRIWVKRNTDLARARTTVANRLHAVVSELVPGGIAGSITVTRAQRLLEGFEPRGGVESARCELAHELVADLDHLDGQLREVKSRIASAVTASGSNLTELFGIGPVIAAILIAYSGDVGRFRSSDRYASYNGTAPVEVSSGPRVVYRLSRRGNRRLNYALHLVAVTQIRHRESQGGAYYARKLAEGKTPKEAKRALKRRISDAVYRQLRLDAARRQVTEEAREGTEGRLGVQRGQLTPSRPALRTSHSRARPHPRSAISKRT